MIATKKQETENDKKADEEKIKSSKSSFRYKKETSDN